MMGDGEGTFGQAMIDFFAGVVLIFLLFLVASSVRLQVAEANRETLANILAGLQNSIAAENARYSVRQTSADALELESVVFPDNSAQILPASRDYVATVARQLAIGLRCYVDEPAISATLHPPACTAGLPPPACPDPSRTVRVETVLIEGHTDSRPVRTGRFASNEELSAARAISVLAAMTEACPELERYRTWFDPNDPTSGQPILGLAGYGPRRPKLSERGEDMAASRRVEMRLIMRAPGRTAGGIQSPPALTQAR